MEIRIACIVEGHGEVEAVPILVRRLIAQVDPSSTPRLPPPQRLPKSKLVRPGELEKAVELAARKVAPRGAVLVVLDSDDDCPAVVGPDLLARASKVRPDLPVAVVLAKREFEAWFLAAAPSIRGQRGLNPDMDAPPNPEEIRGAKEWLSRQMTGNRAYVETLDQPALTALFDLNQARQADSFDKFCRELTRVLNLLKPSTAHPSS